MGYRDYKLMLSDSQAVTADADSTYYLDTEVTYPKWEKNNKFGIVVTVEAKTTAGTGINFIVCHRASEPTVDNTNLITVRALAADLFAGAEIWIPFPNGISILRYIRLYYDIIAGTESYTLSAFVTPLPA